MKISRLQRSAAKPPTLCISSSYVFPEFHKIGLPVSFFNVTEYIDLSKASTLCLQGRH